MIDSRFSADPCCGHCGSRQVGGWSSQAGLKRYRCKDCAKTFNALTGTPLAQLHRRDAWFAYAQALADGLSLRKAATRCGVSLDTAFRWRHRFLKTAKDTKPKVVAGIVEANETFIRKSVKGSKIVRDRHGETTGHVLPDFEGATFVRILKPIVAQDALLVSDGRAAYAMFADHAGFLHIALNASKGEQTYGSYDIQNVNGYISRLKHWLHRFKGVATHYLSGMAANDRA